MESYNVNAVVGVQWGDEGKGRVVDYLASDAEHYAPYEKHHSTVKDACTAAEKLHVENLILYHTEDSDMGTRKERYTAEGKRYYKGNLYVPDDLETICLTEEEKE